MRDTNEVVKLIEAANAVPSAKSLPTGAYSSSDILARIDERYIMSDTKTRTPQSRLPEGHTRRWGYRGPLIALVSAAAGVLIFLGFTNLRPDDTAPVVVSSPTTITESTGPRIIVDRAQRAMAAGTPLLETVEVFQRRFDAGDVEGYEAIFHPDAGYPSGQDAEAAWFGAVTGMSHERNCEVVAETQVRCVERSGSGLEPGTFSDEIVTVWNGADGYIWSIEFPDGAPPVEFSDPSASPGVAAYRDWLQKINPEAFGALFVQGAAMKVDTDEARASHRDFVPFFLSSTGPRSERALPVDTPLVEVVDRFTQLFDAGDVEGYEAIFHPDAGYPSGQDAEAAWFGAVTGMSHERNCEVVAETQVRCVERSGSGLEPGTFSDEIVTVWNGADGYIWSIEFPDGAPPVEFSDPSKSPGVANYRQWVESTAPDVFVDLFDEDLAMRLESEGIRALHRELIERFLADTTG